MEVYFHNRFAHSRVQSKMCPEVEAQLKKLLQMSNEELLCLSELITLVKAFRDHSERPEFMASFFEERGDLELLKAIRLAHSELAVAAFYESQV